MIETNEFFPVYKSAFPHGVDVALPVLDIGVLAPVQSIGDRAGILCIIDFLGVVRNTHPLGLVGKLPTWILTQFCRDLGRSRRCPAG
jgi:hypothetical protein